MNYVRYMLNRIRMMVENDGIPEELFIDVNGGSDSLGDSENLYHIINLYLILFILSTYCIWF